MRPPASRRSLSGATAALAMLLLAVPPAAAEGWPFDFGGDDADDATEAPTSAVRVFKLAGPVHEAPSPWSALGLGDSQVFGDLITRIGEEASDPTVKALVFRFGAVEFGMAQLETLRRELRAATAAGKRVITHFETGDNAQLIAATAADEVHMTPEGTVFLTGLRAEISYYKGLLSTLGVEADIEAVGRFKSAAEPMTRRGMSDDARQAMDAVLDSVFESFVGTLASNRGLSIEAARALVDAGMLSAEEAKRRRLVDTLGYWPELIETLSTRFAAKATLAWPIVESAPQIGSLFGLFELLTRNDDTPKSKRPKIAVVVAEGPIISGERPGGLFDDDPVIAADDLLSTLRAVTEDSDVKAIVLRIDSPGGSALASDLIWRALERIGRSRPVVVSMGNVAASGGYYIASAAKRIFAEHSTLTGSIGVFGGKLVLDQLMDKLGVHTEILSRGRYAGLFSPATRFDDGERALLRANMAATYQTFVNRVARGRRTAYDAVDAVAQGRVWTGAQAQERGLVDALGGLREATAAAAKLARVEVGTYDVVRFPRERSFFELFSEDPTVLRAPKLRLSDLGAALPTPLSRRAAHLGRLLEHLLASEVSLAMMPFAITIQ